MLTEPHGLNYITSCEQEGFHTHPKEPPLYEVSSPVHVILYLLYYVPADEDSQIETSWCDFYVYVYNLYYIKLNNSSLLSLS